MKRKILNLMHFTSMIPLRVLLLAKLILLVSVSSLTARSAALYLRNVGDEPVYYSVAHRKAIIGFQDWKVSGWYELKPRERKRVETFYNPGQIAIGFFKRGGSVVYPFNLQGKALVRHPTDKIKGWHVSDTEPHNFQFTEFSEPSSDRSVFLPASYDMYFTLSSVQMSWQSHYELEVEVPSYKSDKVTPISSDARGNTANLPDRNKNKSINLPGNLQLDLIHISAGVFMRWDKTHSPDRQQKVTLTEEFWLGKYEVTQAQWTAIMRHNPSDIRRGPKYPVDSVSWDDAVEFCRKLSEIARQSGDLADDEIFSLPSEAQWEYACRAGNVLELSRKDIRAQGNFNGSEPTIVGSFKPNAWGLHDMFGNIWEWTKDYYGDYPLQDNVTDPVVASESRYRVARGGGWRHFLSKPYSFRRGMGGSYDGPEFGFRVALVKSAALGHRSQGKLMEEAVDIDTAMEEVAGVDIFMEEVADIDTVKRDTQNSSTVYWIPIGIGFGVALIFFWKKHLTRSEI